MKIYSSCNCRLATDVIPLIWLVVIITLAIILLHPASALRAQEIKNDRILAPEVSHFTRPSEPGVDALGISARRSR